MLKSKLSRGLSRKRRQKNKSVEPAEVLETKMLLSATSGDVHSGQTDMVNARIVNGSETSDYEAVGIVNGGCTGTLISSTHVLTAAHCTEGVGDRRGTFEVGGQEYKTADITDHPQYNANNFDAGYDLSVLTLEEPVTGIAPFEIYRETPQVGQMLTLVGFGEGGTSRGGSTNDFGTKRVGETRLDEVTALHINWNFDSHNESNTAPGDSGGPAFVTVGGELQIAGITSGGTGDAHTLGDYSFDSRVDVFSDWIDNIVGEDNGGGGGGGGDDDGGDNDGGGNGDRHEFSNEQGKNIRDDRVHTITSAIDVSGVDGNITDLNVAFDIEHTWTEDLVAWLIAPNGQKVQLFKEVGGDGQNFDRTELDDEAGTSINNADAPFRGTFKPAKSLAKFDGLDPNGTWKLKIKDTYEEDGGRLNNWKLSFETDADSGGGGDEGGGSNSGSFTNSQRVEIAADKANTIKSTLNVDGLDGDISDINVKLNIDHTWDSDLLVTLVSPSGTRVQLVRYVGDDGDGFNNTILDQDAGTSIKDGDAPFSGTFKPHRSLDSFNDEDPNGTWTLVVRDRYEEDGGALKNWTLEIETDGSRDRSADTMSAREKKVARFRSVRQEMRKGRINRVSAEKEAIRVTEMGAKDGVKFESSDLTRLENYRNAKANVLSDRVFAMVDWDSMLSSL